MLSIKTRANGLVLHPPPPPAEHIAEYFLLSLVLSLVGVLWSVLPRID